MSSLTSSFIFLAGGLFSGCFKMKCSSSTFLLEVVLRLGDSIISGSSFNSSWISLVSLFILSSE